MKQKSKFRFQVQNTFAWLLVSLMSMCFFASCETQKLVSITILPENSSIHIGETQKFQAFGIYENGETKNITNYVGWHSSKTDVATITPTFAFDRFMPQSGTATGVSLGLSVITATSGLITSNEAVLTVAPKFVYIASGGAAFTAGFGQIRKCDVNSTTGQFSNCVDAGLENYVGPGKVVLNKIENTTYAYISDSGFGTGMTVFKCTVNATTGLFTDCTAKDNMMFSNPAGLGVFTGLNSDNTYTSYLFVINNNDGNVSKCPLDSSNGNIQACVVSGFYHPSGMPTNFLSLLQFIRIGTQEFFYVANGGGPSGFAEVIKCSVSISGTLSNCDSQITGISTFKSTGLSIAQLHEKYYAYIVQGGSNFFVPGGGNAVSRCDVSSVDGSFSNCTYPHGSGFNGPFGIEQSFINSELYTYVSNPNFSGVPGHNTMQCRVDPINKNLINCIDSGIGVNPSFPFPVGITFF